MGEKELTIIMSFLNEKEEVRNTILNILKYANNLVDIIVINDASTDLYDYESDLSDLNILYIKNDSRKGSPASRDIGVGLVKTPYFLILDAHMRFYDSDWVHTIVNTLKENDRRLLCCNTKALFKSDNGEILEPKRKKVFGAKILFDTDSPLDVVWNTIERKENTNIELIPCVLGASYATSKKYWTYLKGLRGLVNYGGEEAYISMKVYLEGGTCELLKNTFVGHIYRDIFPYEVDLEDIIYNKLFIAELLLPSNLKIIVHSKYKLLHISKYNNANKRILINSKEIAYLKDYYKQIFNNDFETILDLNNYKTFS